MGFTSPPPIDESTDIDHQETTNRTHDSDDITPASVDTTTITTTNTTTRATIGSETVISPNSITPIPFDTVLNDELGGFDPTANEFIAQQAGRYIVSARAMFKNWSNDARLDLFVRNNNTTIIEDWHHPGGTGGFTGTTLTGTLTLSPGDTIDVVVRQGTGSDQTLDDDAGRTEIDISKIG